MKIIFTLFLCISGLSIIAQDKLPSLDKSPMDMAYYPADYPVLKIQNKVEEPLIARVIYSRPQKAGRNLFGDLIEYGKVWRLGANEATEIEFFQNVSIGDTKVKKGRYSMYAIPNQNSWEIILNKELDTWGSFNYDPKKDILRTTVSVMTQENAVENFVMAFAKGTGGINLDIAWDNVKVSLPISL